MSLLAVAFAVLTACEAEAEPGAAPTRIDQSFLTQEPAPTTVIVIPGLSRDGPAGTFAYTIQSGDTLFSLAQQFGTTVEQLIAINAIADPEDIPIGAVIFIPNAPTPTPTPVPSGPSMRVEHGPRTSNAVALTFDLGGRVDPALDIMQFLIDNGIHATIFATGSTVESQFTDVGRQVLALVEDNPSLFDLGNHSYSHPDFRELTPDEMREELSTTEAAFAEYIDVSPRPLFRPPYGGVDQRVLDVVGDAGYPYTIMWEVDAIDWLPEADGGPTAQEIVDKVVNNAQAGTIVLMHLGGYNTLAALPALVAGLEARGFTFATVAELLGE